MKLSSPSGTNLALLVTLLLSLAGAVTQPDAAEPGADLTYRTGESIPLDLRFRDERGELRSLRERMGHPTILTLNYYECKSICTPMLSDLAAALEKLPLEPGEEFRVLTLSISPAETPLQARRKKASILAPVTRPFPDSAWSFLTGDENSIRALSRATGYLYSRQGDGYLHPGALVILSPEGKIIRYINGKHYLPLDLEMALMEASRGRVGQTIRKNLLTCFRYDPGQKRYVLDITRVGGALVLSGSALFLFLIRTRKSQKHKQGGTEK